MVVYLSLGVGPDDAVRAGVDRDAVRPAELVTAGQQQSVGAVHVGPFHARSPDTSAPVRPEHPSNQRTTWNSLPDII